jgi:hypothetical protein
MRGISWLVENRLVSQGLCSKESLSKQVFIMSTIKVFTFRKASNKFAERSFRGNTHVALCNITYHRPILKYHVPATRSIPFTNTIYSIRSNTSRFAFTLNGFQYQLLHTFKMQALIHSVCSLVDTVHLFPHIFALPLLNSVQQYFHVRALST